MSDKIKHPTLERRMCAVSEDVLFWAFRYALGRQTGSVADVVDAIIMNVSNITHKTALQMIQEIEDANTMDEIGMDIDRDEWMKAQTILKKKVGVR